MVSLGFISSTALANSSDRVWVPMMTLSGGPGWAFSGENQRIVLQPSVERTFIANKKAGTLATGEFFIGWQRILYPHIAGQVGFAFATSSSAKFKGKVLHNSIPGPNDMNYHYKVNFSDMSVKGKLLMDAKYCLQAYLSGSLGVGFNRTHEFRLKPEVPRPILPFPAFTQHTKTGVTYTLGLGMQAVFNAHWQAGLGYEFADRGKFHFAIAPNQTIGSGLQLNNLYVHQLQFSLSYLA